MKSICIEAGIEDPSKELITNGTYIFQYELHFDKRLSVCQNKLPQQTQRRCHNVVTMPDNWLNRYFQFVGNESFADISCKRGGNVKK